MFEALAALRVNAPLPHCGRTMLAIDIDNIGCLEPFLPL